jgi:FkbM family methyltransferase
VGVTTDSVMYRLAVHSGRLPSIFGELGRRIGRHRGVRLTCGYRMVIHDPREYIQRCVLAYGAYEPGIAGVLAAVLRPGDLFFDVGANIGHHSLVAASRGATVHAFEPVPRLAERLGENFRFNGIQDRLVLNVAAVGAEPGTAILYEADRPDDGSHSIIPGVPAASHRPHQVKVVTLDAYAARVGSRPALIKVDVEGYEARVLDGATGLLRGTPRPFVVLETGDRLADQIGESARSVLGRLEAMGYQLYRLEEQSLRADATTAAKAGGELANYLAAHPTNPDLSSVLRAVGFS